MKHLNDLAHQLAISDVHLSMDNARALEHLNNRWKVLQVDQQPTIRTHQQPTVDLLYAHTSTHIYYFRSTLPPAPSSFHLHLQEDE